LSTFLLIQISQKNKQSQLVKHLTDEIVIYRPQKDRLYVGPDIGFHTGQMMNKINKKEPSETDICDLFIAPVIKDAGWKPNKHIRQKLENWPKTNRG
jgi:hypothetical protein